MLNHSSSLWFFFWAGFRKLVSLMKNMDLKSTETEFKIDDTNSQIHFTALIEDQPQSFPVSTVKTTQITTDNADLNDFNDDGRYAGNAMRIQNCPSTGYFLLDVADGGEFKTQFYTDVQNNYRYMRSYVNGSWSAWSWIGFWN